MKHTLRHIMFVFAALIGLSVYASAQTNVATDTAQKSPAQTVTMVPVSLAKTPMLLLTEDTVLPQGLVNIALVSKDTPIADSLKLINTTAGRNYTRPSDLAFEKTFIENHQQKIRESFDKAGGIQREHLIPIVVTRTPDKVAPTGGTSGSSGSN